MESRTRSKGSADTYPRLSGASCSSVLVLTHAPLKVVDWLVKHAPNQPKAVSDHSIIEIVHSLSLGT